MKILVINSNAMFEDSKGLYIYKETGKFLNELNHVFQIENFHYKRPFNGNDAMANYNLKETQIQLTALKIRKSKVLSYVVAYTTGLKRLMSNDFLYLFYPNSFFLLGFAAVILRKPFGLYVRGEKGISSWPSTFLFKRAAFIATVSPRFTNNTKPFCDQSYTIKPMMGFGAGDIVTDRTYEAKPVLRFLFIGRVERDKGIYELIEAFDKLLESGITNFVVDVAGEGADMEAVKQMLQGSVLADKVILHGPVYDKDRIRDFYLQADVFLLPTHHEGFPRVLYEAMIFGTPIITTFVGSISYVMKDQENCYEIQPKNGADLYAKMLPFFNNYKKHAQVAVNGTATIKRYLEENSKSHLDIVLDEVKMISNGKA
ncbi:glycosyltransferase involved in cell wall biosynthesis [Chitinophaga sp. W2I13]|uniref:glycosyltransferase n=1 Tax=unclassified Chitinophaga TaxID=2619133 RepID=UPI003D244840